MSSSGPDNKSSISSVVDAMFQFVGRLAESSVPAKASKKKNKRTKEEKEDLNKILVTDPVSRLNRIQQIKREKTPQYAVIAKNEIPYIEYTVQCTLGKCSTEGIGPTIKIAKRKSADAMLQRMGCSRPEATSTQRASQPKPSEDQEADLQFAQSFNPVTCLYRTQPTKPVFKFVDKQGESPRLEVTIRCTLGDLFTEGSGPSVTAAKLKAADSMLQRIGYYETTTTGTKTSKDPEEMEVMHKGLDIYQSLLSKKEEITGDADGCHLMGEDIDGILMVQGPEHSSATQRGEERKGEEEEVPMTVEKTTSDEESGDNQSTYEPLGLWSLLKEMFATSNPRGNGTPLEVDSRVHQAEIDSDVTDPTTDPDGNLVGENLTVHRIARTERGSKDPDKDMVSEKVGVRRSDLKLLRKADGEQSDSVFFPEAGESLAKRMKQDQDKGVINEGENVGEQLAERMEKDLVEDVVDGAENVGVRTSPRVDKDGLGDKPSSDLLENVSFGELDAKTTADLRLKRKADGNQSEAVFFSEVVERLAKRMKGSPDEPEVSNQNMKEDGMLTGFRKCISTIFRIPSRTQEGQHSPGWLQDLD